MNISKTLLEKYERGQCNDQEIAMVRQWVASDNWDDLITDDDVDGEIKKQIWADVSDFVDSENRENTQKTKTAKLRIIWSIGIAAGLTVIAGLTYSLFLVRSTQVSNFQANNPHQNLLWFEQDSYEVVLTKNSSANIDFESGNISLSGELMFTPKQDFVLRDNRNQATFNFKRGEIYFVSEYPETSKLIVLRKKEMIFLPPAIQRKIRKQFHIS